MIVDFDCLIPCTLSPEGEGDGVEVVGLIHLALII